MHPHSERDGARGGAGGAERPHDALVPGEEAQGVGETPGVSGDGERQGVTVQAGGPGEVPDEVRRRAGEVERTGDGRRARVPVRRQRQRHGNGTATDYDTGLQWEQKTGSVGFFRRCPEPYCPAGDEFSGTYSATGCSGGSFYIAVSAYGTAWTGTSSGDSVPACNGAFSGTISGTTLTGTGPFGTTISGTIDCSNAAASGTIGGPVTGSWSGTTDYCPDPHDVNDIYTWSAHVVLGAHIIPDGTAFTQFLARLNDCPSTDGTTLTGGFAGHCDWRLPTEVELLGILDPGASGCGSGSPCIDQTVFGPTKSVYWSATTFATYPDDVWDVNFSSSSGVYENHKTSNLYVRAVRAGL